LLGLATVALASCSPTAGLPDFPVQSAAQYPLDTGDSLKVSAYGLDDFSSEYVIDAAGMISLPLIGQVAAGGKTVEQVQQTIADQLTARQILNKPFVNVQVSKYRPFFVVGEVQKPGEYAFQPGMTVLNAISMAGGYTFRANTKKVSIVRHRSGATSTGAANDQTLIQPGDTIRVFESWF
jgi:polysaccharide export outer membrane protein